MSAALFFFLSCACLLQSIVLLFFRVQGKLIAKTQIWFGGRLSRILEKYQTNSGKILWDENHKVPALQFPL